MRLKYTYVAKRIYYRFRHPAVGDVPIPGNPGEPAFHRVYSEFLERATNAKAIAKQAADENSLGWLIGQYQASATYRQLKLPTKREYNRYLIMIVDGYGDRNYRLLTKQGVIAMRKGYEAHARTADLYVSTLSSVLTWAVDNLLLPDTPGNPCLGLKRLVSKRAVKSNTPWSEAEIAKALAELPEATRDAVVVGLYTCQRISTVTNLMLDNFLGNMARVFAFKNNELIDMPLANALRELVDRRRRTPHASNKLLISDSGYAYSQYLLHKHLVRDMRKIGLPGRTFHGIRYASIARLSDMGCDVETIVSVSGHRTYEMAMKYIRARASAARAVESMNDHDILIANSAKKLRTAKRKR